MKKQGTMLINTSFAKNKNIKLLFKENDSQVLVNARIFVQAIKALKVRLYQ